MEINFQELLGMLGRFVLDGFKRKRLAATLFLYLLGDAIMMGMIGVMIVIGHPTGVAVALVATVMAIWLTLPTFRAWERNQADMR